MQREIKFRGKTTGDTGVLVIGYYHFDKQSKKHYICLLETLTRHEVFGDSVGQYTGLKDKNGEDIYVDDLLKYTKHIGYLLPSFTAKVVWIKESACYGYYEITQPDSPFLGNTHFSDIDELQHDFLNHCEIIK